MARILIVDDNQGTRDTFATVLRLEGHEVETASTGRAGVDASVARRFDLYLVDLILPDTSGVDVVRQLRQSGARAPAVIITVFPTFATSFDAADAGAQGYVDGMLLPDELVEVVDQALDGRFPVGRPCCENQPIPARDLGGRPVAKTDTRVKEMIGAIDAHLGESLSVRSIAHMVRMSDSRVRHLFEQQVGISLMKFVKERRLQAAASRLATDRELVSQIAYSVGFSGAKRFAKMFRKRFDMAPTAYRDRFWRGGP